MKLLPVWMAGLILLTGCATQTQTQSKPSVPVTQSVTTTEPADNPFHDYDAALVQKVRNTWNSYWGWQSRFFWPTGTVTVSYQLYPDGHVDHPELLRTSGSKKLDLLAFRAVDESAPFDNFPESLAKLTGDAPRTITFTFHY